MYRLLAVLVSCLGLATFGCGTEVENSGNARLGIVRFDVADSAQQTSVVGLDANGQQVARLDLVHGPFTLSGVFAADHDELRVIGRKLDVNVNGQTLEWETEGFGPTLHMPAHPPEEWAIAVFLADPHVAAILETWNIGFDQDVGVIASVANNGYDCSLNGTHPRECTGKATCTTIVGTSPNTCGGGSPPTLAWMIHQDVASGWAHNQSVIAQCCPDFNPPAPALPRPAFYAIKSCPDCPAGVLCPTMCGETTTGKCVACPGYPQTSNNKCSINLVSTGVFATSAPPGGGEIFDVCSRVDWSCGSGDGICDLDENCANCAADCGCAGFDTCGGGTSSTTCGCTPLTACDNSACGTIDDGCGGTIECGCAGFDTCGGGGASGTCGCTPLTACPADYACGTIDDGCGGTIDCSGGRTCDQIAGKHYVCDAAGHRCCKHGRCDGEDEQ